MGYSREQGQLMVDLTDLTFSCSAIQPQGHSKFGFLCSLEQSKCLKLRSDRRAVLQTLLRGSSPLWSHEGGSLLSLISSSLVSSPKALFLYENFSPTPRCLCLSPSYSVCLPMPHLWCIITYCWTLLVSTASFPNLFLQQDMKFEEHRDVVSPYFPWVLWDTPPSHRVSRYSLPLLPPET